MTSGVGAGGMGMGVEGPLTWKFTTDPGPGRDTKASVCQNAVAHKRFWHNGGSCVTNPTIPQTVRFPDLVDKPLVATFDREQASSDGGAVLLKAAERVYGLVKAFARCLVDKRAPEKIRHTLEDLVGQRIFGIACGHPDGNDADHLADDPIHKLLLGRDPVAGGRLASQPTISRFENDAGRSALYRMGRELAASVIERHRRRLGGRARRITIDLDPNRSGPDRRPDAWRAAVDIFNSHYDSWCYLPLLAFVRFDREVEQYLCAAVLRPGKAVAADGTLGVLSRLLPLLRCAFPRARFLVRLDGGFATPEIFDFLDAEPGLDYVVAMAKKWAVAHGHRSDNPADQLKVLLPKVKTTVSHHPALHYTQIAEAMAAVQASSADETVKLLLVFLVLCASRFSEAAEAQWSEINTTWRRWTLPPERMKALEEHQVPLSVQALAILDRARGLNQPGPLIFPVRSGQRAGRPVAASTVARLLHSFRLVDKNGRRIVVHGFRTTFRVWAGERAKANFSVCEAALAHTQPNQTVAAYEQTDYFEDRKELMQKWADYVLPPSAVPRPVPQSGREPRPTRGPT